MADTPASVTDTSIQRMMYAQLAQMQVDLREIPRLSVMLEETRAMVKQLAERDEERRRGVDDLRLRQNEFLSAQSVLSGALSDLQRGMDALSRRVAEAEQRSVAAMDATSIQNARVRSVESVANAAEEYIPWLKGIRWGLTIIAGLLMLAVAGWILLGVAQSIVQNGLP